MIQDLYLHNSPSQFISIFGRALFEASCVLDSASMERLSQEGISTTSASVYSGRSL